MIASDLISDIITPLRTSDTGEDAMTMMHSFHVRHLPVVNNEELLALISDEDIFAHDLSEPVGTYRLSMLRPFCRDKDHIFEVMSRMAKYKLTLIPVVDEENKYLGVITMEFLLQFYASNYSFSEAGSILILEIPKRSYSLSEIARIVESEDGSILSCFLSSDPESNQLLVTLKINRQDIQGIKSAFERYGYTIFGTFSEVDFIDSLKERYDSLMAYLNV
ncbi:MAG: CBS domain-containing protein [Saprospiraceae bacterium]|nr:CBS domain-containing protein [Saprospiraceae bacterium]